MAAHNRHSTAINQLPLAGKELPHDRLAEARQRAAEYQQRYGRTPDLVPELERLRRQIAVVQHATLLFGLQQEVKSLRWEQRKMPRPSIRAVKRLMKQFTRQQTAWEFCEDTE